MDIPTGETRHFENWLSVSEYQKYKKDFIEANQDDTFTNLNKHPQLNDLSEDEKRLGAKIMTQFLFGVNMAYKRMGDKYDNYKIALDRGEEAEYDSIGYWQDENKYIVRLSWLKEEIKEISKGKDNFENAMGIEGKIDVNDFFELAGVEEAAHLMFYNEKEGDTKRQLKTGDDNLDYFTKESEERALIWKKAYTKHYMPQYYDSLSRTANRVLFARKFDEADQKVVRGFESSRIKNKPDGWITTNGVFYGCTPEEHDELAKYLLEKHKPFINNLLIQREHYELVGNRTEDKPPREILKLAGFALLSDDQLAETNLPDVLTLRQLDFVNRNKLVFTPKSGQLSLEEYQSFLESVKNSEGIKRLLDRKNKVIQRFLDDPTKTIHIQDNDSFAEKVFNALTENSTGEISLKLRKEKITWKKIDIQGHDEIFVEYQYHDHGYEDVTPQTEAFIMLTNKKAIMEYLEEKRKTGNFPKGDLNLLN